MKKKTAATRRTRARRTKKPFWPELRTRWAELSGELLHQVEAGGVAVLGAVDAAQERADFAGRGEERADFQVRVLFELLGQRAVRGVGDGDEEVLLVDRDRHALEAAGERLGDRVDRSFGRVEVGEVDRRQAQLFGQHAEQRVLLEGAAEDEDLADPAAGRACSAIASPSSSSVIRPRLASSSPRRGRRARPCSTR